MELERPTEKLKLSLPHLIEKLGGKRLLLSLLHHFSEPDTALFTPRYSTGTKRVVIYFVSTILTTTQQRGIIGTYKSAIDGFHEVWFHFWRTRVGVCIQCSCVQKI